MSDRHGIVAASSDGIGRRANVSPKATEQALSVLAAPDARSKSQDFDGRRIERVDGGYHILNYQKYREMPTEKQKITAARQKRFREKKRDVALRNADITPLSRQKTPKAEAKAEAKVKTKTTLADSGESASWVVEGVAWWKEYVGEIKHGRFGAALKETVGAHSWPPVFAALKCYAEEEKAKGRSPKPEWCAQNIVHWLDWSQQAVTDKDGLLTPRGRAMTGL